MEYLLPPCVGLPGGSRSASREIIILGKRFSLFPHFATGEQNVDAVEFRWTVNLLHRYPFSEVGGIGFTQQGRNERSYSPSPAKSREKAMKAKFKISKRSVAQLAAGIQRQPKRSLVLRSLSLLVFVLTGVFVLQGQNTPRDPGPRTGTPAAGSPIAGLTASQQAYFTDGQTRFQEVESVQNGKNNGLGPSFNSNSCSSCHAQPSVGGTSPTVNPQIAVANADGASNNVPPFITLNGPVREARFKFALDSNGRMTNVPDGGVHGMFTIQGRSDAGNCQMSQPNFERMMQQNNIALRIPTPTFGLGLIESISEDTIMANQA